MSALLGQQLQCQTAKGKTVRQPAVAAAIPLSASCPQPRLLPTSLTRTTTGKTTTGEVRLVRGKQSYLVDPRKEIHITRTLSPDDWNLWIAPGEPHKATGSPVTTPWAVSIVVPHNTAVLATSAVAQRIIEGPCVALLEYEETLVPLRLSTQTPKSDDEPLVTCFLRTVGNRVSDIIEVETADFVRIRIRVTCSVTFLRESKERDKWFNAENYIQVMSPAPGNSVVQSSDCRAAPPAQVGGFTVHRRTTARHCGIPVGSRAREAA